MSAPEQADALKLVLCPDCASEITNGDVVMWSACVLCSARHQRVERKTLEAVLRGLPRWDIDICSITAQADGDFVRREDVIRVLELIR
jgi:hypothetical protein